jgi:hypothetical protein
MPRECAGSSFSSASSSTAREVDEEFLQQQFHNIKPLVLGSSPEMGNDHDGDLQRVTGPPPPPPPAPPAVKKKRSLPGTPGACTLVS